MVKRDTLHTRKQSPVALLWKGIFKYFCKFFQKESFRDVLMFLDLYTGKVTVFGDFLVRVFPHSDCIGRYKEYTEPKCRKMQTRETPNTHIFYAVKFKISRLQFFILFFNNVIFFNNSIFYSFIILIFLYFTWLKNHKNLLKCKNTKTYSFYKFLHANFWEKPKIWSYHSQFTQFLKMVNYSSYKPSLIRIQWKTNIHICIQQFVFNNTILHT